MIKTKELELLNQFGIHECSLVLKKVSVDREGCSQSHQKNKQPEASSSNGLAHFLVEVVEKSRNLNHIVVPERPIIPRVILPEVQLRDAYQRELQPVFPEEMLLHERIMNEIKEKLDKT